MFAAFASDEHGFFSSPDIQLLRIGTIVRPGILLPSKFDIHNTQKCEYNVMSVSIDPKDGYHLIEDFYNKFDTNLTTIWAHLGMTRTQTLRNEFDDIDYSVSL